MYLIRKKTAIKLFFMLLIVIITSSATIVSAEGYIPLEPLTESAASGITLSSYLDDMFKIGISIAGVFAVLMIVVGGIGYIAGASSPSARTEAKSRITNAIFGLILAIASWLLLNTINPELLKTEIEISSVSITATSTGPISGGTIETDVDIAVYCIKQVDVPGQTCFLDEPSCQAAKQNLISAGKTITQNCEVVTN